MRSPAAIRVARVGPLLMACLGLSRSVAAFPSSRLVYTRSKGAEQCPDEATVRREVASRLGYDPFFPWAERVIVAQVARATKGFRATVQLADPSGIVRGARELAAPADDCAELLKSIALAISIAIDPQAADQRGPIVDMALDGGKKGATTIPSTSQGDSPREAREQTAPPPVTPPAAADRPVVSVPAATSPERASPVTYFAGAGVHLATAWVAPAPSVGASVHVGGQWRSLSIALEGRADLPASSDGVTADLVAGSIVPCAETRFFFVCVLGSAGVVFAKAQARKNAPYAALGGRLGASVGLSPIASLRGYFEAVTPVIWTDTTFEVDSQMKWTMPSVAGSAGFDAVVHF